MLGPSTSLHVEKLREEIRIIRREVYLYQQAKTHTFDEMKAQRERHLRLVEIRSQLEQWLSKKTGLVM